jgi:hypothetical protein
MADWNMGAQPFCHRHGWEFHSCCNECRHEHEREKDTGPCKACLKEKKKR